MMTWTWDWGWNVFWAIGGALVAFVVLVVPKTRWRSWDADLLMVLVALMGGCPRFC